MEQVQDIELEQNQEQIEMQMLEAEEAMEMLEEHSQRMIEQQELNLPAMDMPEEIKVVKNPVSPYMIFVSTWKQRHPQQKFNMSSLGQIWKAMTLSEKQPFESEYKEKRKAFDEYQALLQLENPTIANKEIGSKFVIPLSRIRAIMRQDQYYAPKTEAYSAMAKAAEYFADFFLEEVKRMSEGKNRIDHRLLYECINNQRSLSFLQCLIQEYNLQNGETKQKKNKPEIRLELEEPMRAQKGQPFQQNKPKPVSTIKLNSSRPAASGQMSLDSFFSKQR